MALTDKLVAIADAIRGKTGKTAEMTLDAMPTEITSIITGSNLTIQRISRSTSTTFDISNYVEDGKNFILFFTVNTVSSSSSYSLGIYNNGETGALNTTGTSSGVSELIDDRGASYALARDPGTYSMTLNNGVLSVDSKYILGGSALLVY